MKVSVVTLGLLLLLVGDGECRARCWSRRERGLWEKILPRVNCMQPVDQLVPLPKPKEYDWIHPDVVIVKKCRGHLCVKQREECVGTKSVNRTFTVEGHLMNHVEMSCVKLTVVEDEECGCRCVTGPEHCTNRQVFDERMCQCECRNELKTTCLEKMIAHPNTYMWDPSTCTCPCNNTPEECPSGTHWVPEFCSCRQLMD